MINTTLTSEFSGPKRAKWLGALTPCLWCRAKILRRRETASGKVYLEVEHSRSCAALNLKKP